MPSKKKKYNARFPAGRIKKIMQSDEEIGKVAQAVPVIISRTLELFVESLLTKTLKITNSRNARTLSTSHMKQCIMSEQRFDFLRELVKNIPDISVAEDEAQSSPEEQYPDSDTPYDLSMPSTSTQATQLRHALTTNGGGGGSGGALGHNSLNNGNINNNKINNVNNKTLVNYNRRGGGGINSTNSVIMHTTSLASSNNNNNSNRNEQCLPLKLTRSESTPAQMSLATTPSNTSKSTKPIWRPMETSPTTPRKRLKQQSHSMPNSNNNNQNNNNNNNNNNSSSNTLPKLVTQQINDYLYKTQPQTAISAPIVNYDDCTKPIVKIDYSNLPLTQSPITCTTTAPMSAPVLGIGKLHNAHNNNNNNNNNSIGSAFSFDVASPVINIDLSNLVTTTTDATSAAVINNKSVINGPAIATISIGALPLTTVVEEAEGAVAVAAAAASSLPLPSPQISSLKLATPATPMPTTTSTAAPVAASTKSNALFELDEDYDNI